jgi:hypothetical protein
MARALLMFTVLIVRTGAVVAEEERPARSRVEPAALREAGTVELGFAALVLAAGVAAIGGSTYMAVEDTNASLHDVGGTLAAAFAGSTNFPPPTPAPYSDGVVYGTLAAGLIGVVASVPLFLLGGRHFAKARRLDRVVVSRMPGGAVAQLSFRF